MNSLPDKWKSPGCAETGEDYDPALLLNSLLSRMHLTEDAQLAKRLQLDRRLLGQIREGRLQISGSMLMLIQEASGITITELRHILGDRRGSSRMACKLEQRK